MSKKSRLDINDLPACPKSSSTGVPKLVTANMGWIAKEKQMSEMARATNKM